MESWPWLPWAGVLLLASLVASFPSAYVAGRVLRGIDIGHWATATRERPEGQSMALDYYLLVFVSAIGAIQVAASYSRLDGLLLLGRRASLAAGVLLIVGAFGWFFLAEPRNVPDTAGGLDGNEQAALFSAAAGSAVVCVFLLSSLRHWSMIGGEDAPGLEALRHSGYLRLAWQRVSALRRRPALALRRARPAARRDARRRPTRRPAWRASEEE